MRKVEKAKTESGELIVPDLLNNDDLNAEWEAIAKQDMKLPGSMSISKKIIEELNKYYYGKCAYCESRATFRTPDLT